MPRIEVAVRLRPDSADDKKGRIDRLKVDGNADQGSLSFQTGETHHSFQFDKLFDESSTQTDIYDHSCAKIVESALDGYHGCVFAYGQTGAGKTHTMSGQLESGDSQQFGVCGHAIVDMFRRAKRSTSAASVDSITFRLSVLEVYNEVLYDLLSDSASLVELPSTAFNSTVNNTNNDRLSIIETAESGVIVPNLKIMPIGSAQEAINLLMEAHANRAIAEHQLNLRSSRSHVIYSFYITRSSTHTKSGAKSSEPVVWQSKLHFVDLAGSERQQKTKSTGSVQREANYINKSLTYLEQVVVALSQANRDHIPYRQSKLTYLLKDSLGGNCLTLLLACIWPRAEHAWETLSTMRFAARMKNIELNPVRNKLSVGSYGSSVNNNQTRAMQVQIEQLRRELALRDTIHGRNEAWLPDLSSKQKLTVCQSCVSYTTQNVDIKVNCVSQFQLMLDILKVALRIACEGDEQRIQRSLQTAMSDLEVVDEATLTHLFQSKSDIATTPDRDSASQSSIVQSLMVEQAAEEFAKESTEVVSPTGKQIESTEQTPTVQQEYLDVVVDEEAERQRREQQLREFTSSGQGRLLQQSYEETVETLKAAKARQREIVNLINERKAEIDRLTSQLQQSQQEQQNDESNNEHGDGSTSVNNMEEVKRQLDSAKSTYRLAYQELKLCKEQIEEMQSLKQRAMSAVLAAFHKSQTP